MFNALKKLLGIRTTTNHSTKYTEAPLFSGSAYFSNRVPRALLEEWVAHGGEICSGPTWDVRARYFFAIDPTEPWVTKLFAKSVMVIHAGWIVHCVDDAFRVPIAEYILDDGFVPAFPYKLTSDVAPTIFVPLSEPEESPDAESGESGPTPVQTSDTPSTPTSMPRKRKREQAYFDSPSGSLVFSGFDKDGMPRRPKKQRKLRFDPSFSPDRGRSSREAVRGAGFNWFQDHHVSRDGDQLGDQHGQFGDPSTLRGYLNALQYPDTPDKPLASGGPSATYRCLSSDEHLPKLIHTQEKVPPVRTIDFTKLPPPTRRWRFPMADGTKSQDTGTLSIVKATDNKVKTLKKISFADHARVRVYTVSPTRSDAKDGADVGLGRQPSSERLEVGPEVSDETRVSGDGAMGSGDGTAGTINDSVPHMDSPQNGDDLARLPDEGQPGLDTFTLTMEEAQAMRHRLLESVAKGGVDNTQLATLFELGKTFQGKTFYHVW